MKQFSAFLAAILMTGSLALAQPPSCATPGTDNAFLGIVGVTSHYFTHRDFVWLNVHFATTLCLITILA